MSKHNQSIIKKLAVRPIAYLPVFAEITGSVTAAVVMSQVLYWWQVSGEREFYKTDEEFGTELCMSLDQFRRAKNHLKETRFVKIYVQGVPGKTYYDIDFDLMEEAIGVVVKTPKLEYAKPPKLVSGETTILEQSKPSKPDSQNPQTLYTENTRDITNEDSVSISSTSSEQKVEEKVSTRKKKTEGVEVPLDKLKQLPIGFGKTSMQRLVTVYSLLWEDQYGSKPIITNWAQLGKMYKPLLAVYTEYQLASMIILHFEWKGAGGDDEFTFKNLSNACFPLDRLPRNASAYQAFITNSIGIDFNDPERVKKHVVDIIKPLVKKD